MKLIRDIVKRDFGNKVSSFMSRVTIQCEAAQGANDMDKEGNQTKKKGWLLSSFKIKPNKEFNNFLSNFSLEQIIESSVMSLTELSLRGWFRLNLFQTDILLKGLQSLDLTGWTNAEDETISSMWKSCPKVETLNISGLPRITEEAIKIISAELSYLKAIDFSFCYNIRPGWVRYLAESSNRLSIHTIIAKSLALESVDFQVLKFLPNLKTLSVSGCELLDDSFLFLLSKSKLVNLDIKSNINFSTQGILKLLEGVKPTLKLLMIDKVYWIHKKLRGILSKLTPEIEESVEL